MSSPSTETQEISSRKAALEDLFRSRLHGFFKQLTAGCGRDSCDCLFCKSNPGLSKHKISVTEASLLAMELARQPQVYELTCPELIQNHDGMHEENVHPLDYEMLEQFSLLQDTQSNEYNELKATIVNAFSSVNILSLSFLKSPKSTSVHCSDTGLDLTQISKSFDLINKLSVDVQTEFILAAYNMVTQIPNAPAPLRMLTELRKYIIFLENPAIATLKWRPVTALVLQCVAGLIEKKREFLRINYFEKLPKEKFISFQNRLQHLISMRVLEQQRNKIPNKDATVINATTILGTLWQINQNKNHIDLGGFYNLPLNEYFDTSLEYEHWIRGNPFCFCKYSFILTPDTKSKILLEEAREQQEIRQQEAVQMTMFGYEDNPFLLLRVRREKLMIDSLDLIMTIKLSSLRDFKKPLKVKFEGEAGIDEGGLVKEWFQLLVGQIFSPQYGMFVRNEVNEFYFFDHKSQDINEFYLLGTVLGLAIYNGIILDLHFPLMVYKKLVGKKLELSDLAELDKDLYEGLKQLQDHNNDDVEDIFDLNFEISYENYGVKKTHSLLPNGKDTTVTKANKNQYLTLYVEYLLSSSIQRQFDSFKNGFFDVCSAKAISLFDSSELQLLICGAPNLDFKELEKGTTYGEGYHRDHETIRQFWRVVNNFDESQKKSFLAFTTGSDRSPIGGLKELHLYISRYGDDSEMLPTSHTCFNHLELPEYSSEDKMVSKLEKAIVNSIGFGLL
jgi:ubiquitin-protein ligase E3 A